MRSGFCSVDSNAIDFDLPCNMKFRFIMIKVNQPGSTILHDLKKARQKQEYEEAKKDCELWELKRLIASLSKNLFTDKVKNE